MYKLSRFYRLVFRLIPNPILNKILPWFDCFSFLNETKNTQTPISFQVWYDHKVLGNFNNCYWPVHPTSLVQGWNNIVCGVETSPGYSPGNFISANFGKIKIGDYTQIAPNVGIISDNHELTDNRKFTSKNVIIGKYCWIGMGAIILPGVELGDYTIVAAGSIVSKSYKEGYQVIGGNPAKVIKKINEEDCIYHKSKFEYIGYIKKSKFSDFRTKNLNY